MIGAPSGRVAVSSKSARLAPGYRVIMTGPKTDCLSVSPLLVALAAPKEVRAALKGLGQVEGDILPEWGVSVAGGVHVLRTGVGKVNAGAAVVSACGVVRPGAVLSVGIAGALPGDDGMLPIGTVVVAAASTYADEGLMGPEGFRTMSDLGFPLGAFEGNRINAADGLVAALMEALADLSPVCATVATVSTCSGTDGLARQVAVNTGARAEAMEGAAVGHVCSRLGIAFAEVRVISNTTGDRSAQRWDLPLSLSRLAEVLGRIGRARVKG